MTNEEAIKTLEANYPDACFEQLREAVDAAIEALKAQDADSDTISRKAAIDAILAVTGNSSVRELYEHVQEHGLSDMWSGGVNAAIDIIIAVPSARPVAKDTNVPINANDCISRQAAIDALIGITRFKTKHELMQRVNASVQDEQGWLGAVAECLDEIEDLPSAQPQRTGRWIPQKGGGLCCSECGGYALDEPDGNFVHVAVPSKFCPNCGARMEGES